MNAPEVVVCFDRDFTVSVNAKPGEKAVPLSWVKELAHNCSEIDVWATGNQYLRYEAKIPGTYRSKQVYDAYNYGEESLKPESNRVYRPDRRERLRLIKQLYVETAPVSNIRFIVVDDVDLADMEDEGWEHYYPDEFVERVENDSLGLGLDTNPDYSNLPANDDENTESLSYASHFIPDSVNEDELESLGDGKRGWSSEQ